MRRFTGILIAVAVTMVLAGCATGRQVDVATLSDSAAKGDDKAIAGLIELLRNGGRPAEDDAYKALIATGTPAVPQLLAALKDPDDDVREYAAAALGEIGDQRALDPLMAMLRTDVPRRYIAAWALGKMKADSAVPLLIESLAIKNDALQKESTRALIAIGEPSVMPLVTALNSPISDVRKFSARALGIIEDKRAEAGLVSLLSDANPDVQAAAALALGTAGTHNAVGSLVTVLRAPNMMTRVNASIALGILNAKDAVEPLKQIMEADEDPYVREWSARALENITGERHRYKDEHGNMILPYNLYR